MSSSTINRLRTIATRTVAVGGVATVGVLGFPRFEDWYWLEQVKQQQNSNTMSQASSIIGGEKQEEERKKLVILGSGWGSASVLKRIDRDQYDITVVSPRNFFLFTPLLPSVATGTIAQDAVTVPIRDLTSYKACPLWQRLHFMYRGYLPPPVHYAYAAATNIDSTGNKVTCHHVSKTLEDTFDLPYDELVIATGATNNTFGTQGVDEHCHYLKETGDAALIKQQVIENLEKASLPGITEEEKRRLCNFIIVGGGPTGVEFAVELRDFLEEDAVNTATNVIPQYPNCVGYTSVSVIQSNQHLLPGYPKRIQQFSEQHMKDSGIDLITNTRVTKVGKDTIQVLDKSTKTKSELPYGLVVWATGVSPRKLAKKLIQDLGKENQSSHRCIQVNSHCKVQGTDNIWAIGDCADINVLPEYKECALRVFDEVAKNGNTFDSQTGRLDEKASNHFIEQLKHHFHSDKLGLIEDHGLVIQANILDDLNNKLKETGGISQDDAIDIVTEQLKCQKHLPPLAQVAHQQGEYLASKVFNQPKKTLDQEQNRWTYDHCEPFQYHNLGQLVYVGDNKAAMSVPAPRPREGNEFSWGGSGMNLVWHAAYFGMLESPSARSELMFNWMKGKIFGRSTALDAVCTTDSDTHHMDSLTRPRLDDQRLRIHTDESGKHKPVASSKTETTKK